MGLALEGAGGVIERIAVGRRTSLLQVRQPRLSVPGPDRIVAHASQTGFRRPVREEAIRGRSRAPTAAAGSRRLVAGSRIGPRTSKQLGEIGTSAVSVGYRSSAVKNRIAGVPDDIAGVPAKVIGGPPAFKTSALLLENAHPRNELTAAKLTRRAIALLAALAIRITVRSHDALLGEGTLCAAGALHEAHAIGSAGVTVALEARRTTCSRCGTLGASLRDQHQQRRTVNRLCERNARGKGAVVKLAVPTGRRTPVEGWNRAWRLGGGR